MVQESSPGSKGTGEVKASPDTSRTSLDILGVYLPINPGGLWRDQST